MIGIKIANFVDFKNANLLYKQNAKVFVQKTGIFLS
jgi:hypothetical protein